jgi:RsiW-degrading membrane proteinase PrsW (M82 family)
MEAAYRHPWRPARYWIAGLIGGGVLLVIIASSILAILFQQVPARGTVFGLPAVALVVAATVFGVRALHDHDLASRLQDLVRAGVLLGVGLLVWLLVIDVFTFTQAAGPAVAAVATLACLPTTAIGLFVVRRLDRNESEPWRIVMVAVAWGAIVSTSLVVWAETIWDYVATHTLVPGPALDVSTAYSAGIWEEVAKGLAVLLLYLVMRDEFDDVVDGIVYGAAVGLGFNFMESVTYMTHLYAVFSGQGSGQAVFAAASQWYSRQVLGLFFSHATYTALVGAGIGLARQLPSRRDRVLSILSGFLAAIAAHFAWDAWVAYFPISSSPLALVELHLRTFLMQGPFTSMLLVLLAMGLQIEGNALGRQLTAEAATNQGAVLPEEIPVLIRPWQRFRARLRAFAGDGAAAYARLHRLQRAQLELAMERWHRERNEIDEPLAAEEELRRRVRLLREQLA